MKKLVVVASIVVAGSYILAGSAPAFADQTSITPYSWDPGLYATAGSYDDTAHAWGMRKTGGAWGTGGVNYQSGATTTYRANGSGSLSVNLNGTYCPNSCNYGSGSGYKGLVQFWNDPNNYIAFGIIHDPGVSPKGNTLMIEGAAGGRPIGGYWPGGAISGAVHTFTFNWSSSGISLNIDNNVNLGPYPVATSNPSISFLAAGRNTGDITDTTFTGINFSPGSVVADPVRVPSGNPYATYSATVTENGTGTGYSSYINMHDASNNAVSVGIQSDKGAPQSNGQPYYVWERVQNGQFSYQYLGAASHNPTPITLKWWKGQDVAVYYSGSTPIASFSTHLSPRLFFNAEGNARLNGDSVNSSINNIQIAAGDTCPTYCGLNGSWNTTDFNFHGLKATNTNGLSQNGANISVTGTVTGLASGHDWDSDLVAGIGMIAQYWNGQ